MEEVYRILNKGGIFFIETPNIVELRKRLYMLMGKSFMPAIEYVYNNDYHKEHHREYTMKDLEKVLYGVVLKFYKKNLLILFGR